MNRRHTTLIIVSVLIVVALIVAIVYFSSGEPDEELLVVCEEEPEPCRLVYGLPIDSFFVVEEHIKPNTYLSQIFREIGAPASIIAECNYLDRDVFDVRSIRAGKKHITLYPAEPPCEPLYWIYEKSTTEYVVFDFRDSLYVSYGVKPTRIETDTVYAVIESSLWNAAVGNGLSPAFAIELSEIYSWTIDFFGLQKGDYFAAIYDQVYVDSTLVGMGEIHACLFNSGGKDIYAFSFEQDSVRSYFDREGQSLRRAFLKAPLNYSRVSSHFTHARMHPVHRVVRPHTGVDYAAPMGTPVVSIGDGVVTERAYKGGGGNTVKIRHNSVYTTAYLHLSKFGPGIQVGSRVSQGQVIGYVGSTGTSTGPHLDFRVWMNGKPINPLNMESPPVEPVRDELRHEFDSIRSLYLPALTDRR